MRANARLVLGIIGGLVLIAALAVGLWLGLAERLPPVGTEEGELAPDFTLDDLDGEPVTLSDFRGQPVLLYFWQTNCPQCRHAFPEVIELYELYSDRGLTLVTVSTDHNEDTLRAYLRENVPPGSINLWGSLEEAMEIIDLYAISTVPRAVLIDRRGVIRLRADHRRMPTEFDIEEVL